MFVSTRLHHAMALALLAAWAGSAVAASPPNTLSPKELEEGWILLFDGSTPFGWQPTSKADWKVEDGAIAVTEGEPGLLVTTSQFGNYVLAVDFRAGPETNSGIFLRTLPTAGAADVQTQCYELNIAGGDNPFPTGSFVRRKKAEAAPSADGWRTFEVTADGGHFTVRLDGQKVLDYTDPKPIGRGRIGLQFNRGKVAFRNVKLKPLGLKSLFNGKDLSGWKVHPESKSVFSITPEGWLRVQNGKGQLETEQQWADFTLQLEVFVNGTGLNSGIFFRSIPGDLWNGYESQIQNAFKDGDRTKPVDCGTGGIFRRQNARKVVANDREWFHKTIHADGPHMAVWVNGYQVSDWTDTRRPDENPRKGLRLKPGTIILQGHDATTDFFFRNFRIAELPPR
ncbi:MAG: DUF1080 domain-containing protein [Thermoguttaceae bacterium]|nr:DUF1080 domain-containing protein [Thermoguttaceae bacterium]